MAGMPNPSDNTTLAVLRPHQARHKSFRLLGTTPSNSSTNFLLASTINLPYFYINLKFLKSFPHPLNPWLKLNGSGYFSNNLGVTLLTDTSVACADKVTAIRSSKVLV